MSTEMRVAAIVLCLVGIILTVVLLSYVYYWKGYREGYEKCNNEYLNIVDADDAVVRRLVDETRRRILERVRKLVEEQSAETGDPAINRAGD